MASRYPITQVVDYCYNPIHVVDDDKDIIVPCGRCDGCLLHKANEWSMRCGMEIEDTPCTIFGSLTYENKYLPKLARVDSCKFVRYGNFKSDGSCDLIMDSQSVWISDHPYNIRFNGVQDVLREDHITVGYAYAPLDVVGWDNYNFNHNCISRLEA